MIAYLIPPTRRGRRHHSVGSIGRLPPRHPGNRAWPVRRNRTSGGPQPDWASRHARELSKMNLDHFARSVRRLTGVAESRRSRRDVLEAAVGGTAALAAAAGVRSVGTLGTRVAAQPAAPERPESKAVVANGTVLNYLDIGQGEPVVRVHGSLNDLRSWGPSWMPSPRVSGRSRTAGASTGRLSRRWVARTMPRPSTPTTSPP